MEANIKYRFCKKWTHKAYRSFQCEVERTCSWDGRDRSNHEISDQLNPEIKSLKDTSFLYTKYIRIPPEPLLYKSIMNNDDNQELCGGWFPLWIRKYPGGSDSAVIDRVSAGLKPIGVVSNNDKIKDLINEKNLHHKAMTTHNLIVIWKDDRKLSEIFDLESLYKDYLKWVGNYVADDILAAGDFYFKDFINDWDNHGWFTGLILGYPIENTISLYLEGRI